MSRFLLFLIVVAVLLGVGGYYLGWFSVNVDESKIKQDTQVAQEKARELGAKASEQARELGHPEPQPIPHPDDVFIDFVKGGASVCGPLTKEAKAEWDKLLEHLDHMQIEISDYAAMFRKSRTEKKRAFALDMWKFEQKLFDSVNDNLPKRYRKSLKDRCWEKDASRPGQQCKRLWPDED